MNTEQFKRQNIQQQHAVESLHVYAARIVTGDGVKFFCAPNAYRAKKIAQADSDIATDAQIRTATREELQVIAVRALTGNY